jgi:hypothetical protein
MMGSYLTGRGLGKAHELDICSNPVSSTSHYRVVEKNGTHVSCLYLSRTTFGARRELKLLMSDEG